MSSVSATTALIMAAGQGTRMNSAVPKVLHPVCGRAMVAWPIAAARDAGVDRIVVIVSPDRDISPVLPAGVEVVPQPVPDGTGGAIRAAREIVAESETVLVLSGDVPLVSAGMISELLAGHGDADAAATVVTAELDDPGSYGRIVRDPDGCVEAIVETKKAGDASAEELAIREINAGIYVFEAGALSAALEVIGNDNAQGEYYLPDVIAPIRAAGGVVRPQVSDDPSVVLGVNSRLDLATVEAEARRRILERHMLAGTTIVDPAATWIEADVEISSDVRIEPGCSLVGTTKVGTGCVVGPHTTLIDTELGSEVSVPHSYLAECSVADGCSIGPFAHLRPGAEMEAGAKAGAFVEIKNSVIGPGSKVPHLSYVGDADVGAGSNLGAATITANYDGFTKSRTKIGRNVRTGVDTTLVAPVEVGDEAYTGAGAVIREDVPPGALAVTRGEQRNIEDYAERKAAEAAGNKKEKKES
jgi:bifunctional UDP-N-acetylglucosamine pyrophosphorylase/glucosamine-1-phosphate N-acetyltransferase